jgi:hypothetical protein
LILSEARAAYSINCTVKKGYVRTFSSELIHILLLKIPKVKKKLVISHFAPKSTGGFAPKSICGYVTNYFMKYS